MHWWKSWIFNHCLRVIVNHSNTDALWCKLFIDNKTTLMNKIKRIPRQYLILVLLKFILSKRPLCYLNNPGLFIVLLTDPYHTVTQYCLQGISQEIRRCCSSLDTCSYNSGGRQVALSKFCKHSGKLGLVSKS